MGRRRPSARAAIRYSGPSSSPGCRPGCGRRRPSGRRPRLCRRDRRPGEPAAGTAAAGGPRRGWSRRSRSGTSRIDTVPGVRGRPRGLRPSGPRDADFPRGHGSGRLGPCPAHKAGASRARLGPPRPLIARRRATARSEFISTPGVSPAALSEVRISTTPAAREQRVTCDHQELLPGVVVPRFEALIGLLDKRSVAGGHRVWYLDRCAATNSRPARKAEWNPHKATHVPNRRGGISPAGPDRETSSKPLPGRGLVPGKVPQGARTQNGKVSRDPPGPPDSHRCGS